MENNNREIKDVEAFYYNDKEQRTYVDCYWYVSVPNQDKDYKVDGDDYINRGATMAYIYNDGRVEYNKEFEDFARNNETITEFIIDAVKGEFGFAPQL